MGNETALIFGAADCGDWSFLAPYRGRAAVFCADGGVNTARHAGFSPDYFIGDGDSGGVAPAGIPAVHLPVRKDLTDLQAAWEQAFSLGFRSVILDPSNEISFLLPGEAILAPGRFRHFSLLPADARAVVSIRGAEYDLDRGCLRRGDSLGVSNAFRQDPVRILVHEGPCYLILSDRI